jgi:hypothetical protein
MNREDIEQAIYERTRRFVSEDVQDAILELIAAEREACAKVAEWEPCMTDTPKRIAAAIRERSANSGARGKT